MADRQIAEKRFLEHLAWIDRVAAMTCARHRVWGTDAEDFGSWIRIKLMEDDYGPFRKFRGECSLRTYLATVVVRQFHEYWRSRRGRWRPSRAAERLGPPAGELEALVYRDGYPLEQAGEKLRTAGRTALSDTELARLLAQLPTREPLRPQEVSSEGEVDAAEGSSRADDLVAEAEAAAQRERVMGALRHAMTRLEPEEQMIVRMHFADGRTLAEVARTLHLEQKPLYRRVERLRVRLRGYLEDAGVHGDDLPGTIGEQWRP
ncbi:MAG TPA: sigma-70 family RNA polymerase sigma factor [Longimicrobium sp.]|nr:sigma-70 family RNA polymerase sigma factor [Longimicrobium sp.]